jgi:hypothetical protein
MKSRRSREGESPLMYALLGLSVSIFLVLPLLRPGNIPIGYVATAALAVVILQGKIRTRYENFRILLWWLFPVGWIAIHTAATVGLFGFPIETFKDVALNLLAFSVAACLLRPSVGPKTITAFAVGTVPVFLLNGALALTELVNVEFVEGIRRVMLSVTDDQVILSGERIKGLMSHPHVFAYFQSVHLVLITSILYVLSGWGINRKWTALLVCCSLLSSLAILASGQRSASWVAIPLGSVFFGGAMGWGWKMLATGAGVAVTLAIVVELELERLFHLGSASRTLDIITSSDVLRRKSWRAAMEVIRRDPIFGSGYRSSYSFDKGIHNFLLLGWARFGIMWIVLIVGAIVGTVKQSIRDLRHGVSESWVVLGMVVTIISNAFFHTLVPGINDFFAPIALGVVIQLRHLGGYRVRHVIHRSAGLRNGFLGRSRSSVDGR